jgi:YHS domain-containing protein
MHLAHCGAQEKAAKHLLIRIALFFFLIYGFFKIRKILFRKQGTGSQQAEKPSFKDGPQQINEMVQDPVCMVYVPKKEALVLDQADKSYYFCSRSCMNRFQKHED